MLNKVQVIGRITKDIELKQTQTGKYVVNFTLAVDDGKKGDQKITHFIECQAWEKTAEIIAKYCLKGDMFHVEGKLVNHNYESNGVKQYTYKVIVQGMTLLPNKHENKEESIDKSFVQPSLGGDLQRPEERDTVKYSDIKADDLPFY